MQQNDTYISFADAMELLGIDKQRLLRLIKAENLTTYQNVIDRRQRWLERSVIVALKENPMRPDREARLARIDANLHKPVDEDPTHGLPPVPQEGE